MTWREVIAALQRDGWYVKRQGRRHLILRHPTKPSAPAVPRHLGQIAKEGTLNNVLKQANMSVDELRMLL